MDSDILKVIMLALTGVAAAGIIKSIRPEFGVYISIAVSVMIFFISFNRIKEIFDFLRTVYSGLTYGKTIFHILINVLVVSYVTDFTAQFCRDAGEGAIASKTELAGKIVISYLSLPVIISVLDLINTVL